MHPASTGGPPQPDASRFRSALRWSVELVLVCLLVAGVIWLFVLRQKNATLQHQLTAATDSLDLARQRDSLLTEVLDLQTELHARQAGIIPREIDPIKSPPPGHPTPANVQPVPEFVSTEIDSIQRRRAREELARDTTPAARGLRVVYTQSDVESGGADTLLSRRGLSVARSGQLQPRASTSVTLGPGVTDAAGRLAVLALMASGIDVKRVRRSPDSTLAGTLLITYARPLLDWPGLTVDEVLRMSSPRTPPARAAAP